MALITIPNTFSAGATIVASQHNSNFSTISSDYNGNIDNTNIANSAAIAYSKLALSNSILNADINASAAITYSKLSLTGGIVNADINASAAIVDTKFATISTSGKVSGAALTSLSSIPSGAGVIPSANIPSSTYNLSSSTALSGVASSGDIAITVGHFYHVKYAFDSSNNDILSIRINNDTGANYSWSLQAQQIGTSTSLTTTKGTGATSMAFAMAISSSNSSYFDFYIYPGSSKTFIHGTGFDSGNPNQYSFSGYWAGSTPTSFRLITGSASLNGTVYLYEIKQS